MSIANYMTSDANGLEPDSYAREVKILEALEHDVVTVILVGNTGRYGLASLGISGPWSLTVGSYSWRKYAVRVKFYDNFGKSIYETQVYSLNIIKADEEPAIVSLSGSIQEHEACCMYVKNRSFVFERSKDDAETPPPPGYSIVFFSIEESRTIYKLLKSSRSQKRPVYAKFSASERKEMTEPPIVSHFSSKGPCEIFRDFMKPDVCAPGEEIAASWVEDEPLGGIGPILHADCNIMSGTSCAVPHVAAVVAVVRAENPGFSATATISALITSAKKMPRDPKFCEIACGAGVVNFEGALKPGLVYEENVANYRGWLDNMLMSKRDPLSHLKLNVAYLSALLP